tara:strand:- start:1821 stop:2438 length:618 start_codon:yes stop_codon:yes gene_type:complete
MSDFCTCGQQKTLELDYVVKEDETEEVLPPVNDTEKAEEEDVEEEELLEEEGKGYTRKDISELTSLLKQTLAHLTKEEHEEEEDEEKDMDMEEVSKPGHYGEEKNMHYDEEKEMDMEVSKPGHYGEDKEEISKPEHYGEDEEEVSMSVKEALKTLEKSGMSVYTGSKATPATRRVVREKPVSINWSEFSKSIEEVQRMEERAGVN